MSIRKLLAVMLAAMLVLSLAACGNNSDNATTTTEEPAVTEEPADDDTDTPADPEPAPAADSGETPYIAIVSKGFQHQFWQVVNKGAEQAAVDFGVEITFDGPPSESDIADQVDMLKSAINRQPAAICLAALDTESVREQLDACEAAGIPVIGFDSGVPGADMIYATASTDNMGAAAIAADMLYENADFLAALEAATADDPIIVGVLSQDATSESVTSRTSGFIDRLVELVGGDDVEVTGHDRYKKEADGAKLVITVNVPATTSTADLKTGGETLLGMSNIVAIYGSNEAAANGILSASNDGSDFAEGSRYDGIIAMGFDAGSTQRTAVENGWFYGSVTQDPFQIGYKAVALAVDAINGVPAESEIVDTGARWYNSENLSDPSISELVYE